MNNNYYKVVAGQEIIRTNTKRRAEYWAGQFSWKYGAAQVRKYKGAHKFALWLFP